RAIAAPPGEETMPNYSCFQYGLLVRIPGACVIERNLLKTNPRSRLPKRLIRDSPWYVLSTRHFCFIFAFRFCCALPRQSIVAVPKQRPANQSGARGHSVHEDRWRASG